MEHLAAQDARHVAMKGVFRFAIMPDSELGRYMHTYALEFDRERQNGDLSASIARSSYNQADFILPLSQVYGGRYLAPNDVPGIQAALCEMARSKHTRLPELKPLALTL
ncbi:MAG: hypothetical protein KGI97_07895 [Alphaproteobacteria bacterium]|nr:hypothetical protein [Alphaproteobacteria bacterium]